jgi:thioredoxin-like negative regulator of GroEL
MTPSSRDRISVDLRGLRAALFERARSQGVSPSELVRVVLEKALGQAEQQPLGRVTNVVCAPSEARARLSLRMTRTEALAVLAAARQAGMAPGAYVVGLLAAVPVLTGGSSRANHIAELTASSAELSTLIRNIHHLTSLLRQGQVRPAQEYRAMLDTLADDVRVHLNLASDVLAELRPRRSHRADATKHPTT